MRITSSTVDLGSSHLAATRATRHETLRTWVGERRPDFEDERSAPGQRERVSDDDDGPARPRGDPGADNPRALLARRVAGLARRLEAEAAARRPAHQESGSTPAKGAGPDDDATDELEGDPKTRVIKLLVEALIGRKIKVISLDEVREAQARVEAAVVDLRQAVQGAQQPQRAGWGVEYDLHESYHEVEQTTFTAQGVVKTADGKEITFRYELEMEREFHSETNVSIRAGDARLKDPLVVNFGGTAAQLTDARYAFDLDADGTQDQIAWVQPGSGFLALDKNGNGAIDDGSELFGAQSGDGFAELAAHDRDGNGWIDEADPVYQQLRLWSKDGATDQLATLQERNVGAIYLGNAATPFQLKDAENELQGAVRASGIYVKENGGGVGSVQQVDLAV